MFRSPSGSVLAAPTEPSIDVIQLDKRSADAPETSASKRPLSETPATKTPDLRRTDSPPAGRASPSRKEESELKKPAQEPSASKAEGNSAPVEKASDVELLARARALLATSPAESLSLTEEHRSSYPRSPFVQEREFIAITALTKLGRQQEAQTRAERFRRAYPTSAHLRQLEKIAPPP
jgi:hypothetical protein